MTLFIPAPGPDGLTLDVPCGTDQPEPGEVGHAVTVRPDWSVTVPHDLETERIAAAFGAATPCLDLAANLAPALWHVLEVVSHTTDSLVDVRWCTQGRCLGTYVHDSAEAAYRHEITPRHLAARFGLRTWQADRLLEAVREAWIPTRDGGLVAEGREGYARLWDSAIHPAAVTELATVLPPVLLPMPASFYLDLAYSGIEPDWLRGVLTLFPDAGLARVLAGWRREHRLPSLEEVTELHSLGLRPDGLGAAIQTRTPVASIRAALQRAPEDPLLFLAWQSKWQRVGCYPRKAHFTVLADRGIPHVLPESAAIDATLALCRLADASIGRTEVGIMLAVLGEPILVAEAVSHEVTSALDPRLTPTATRGETR